MVKEFTEESTGISLPKKPCPMDQNAVEFLAKMMFSEIVELLMTHHKTHEEALEVAKNLLDQDFKEKESTCNNSRVWPLSVNTQIEEQMDALVDCHYYALNAAAKHGMNIDPVFDLVHQANMNKRDPTTKQFLRRDDGKIIKPVGWKPADISKEVERQLQHGSF